MAVFYNPVTGGFQYVESTVQQVSGLRAVPSAGLTAGQTYFVSGTTSPADGGGGMFAWSPTSSAADDGMTVIKPSDIAPTSPGRWILNGSSTTNALAAEDVALDGRLTVAESDISALQQQGQTGGTLYKKLWADVVASTTAYNSGTAYTTTQTMVSQGVMWVALQDNTNQAPPTLPTTSNAYWEVFRNPLIGQVFIVSTLDTGTHTDPATGVTGTPNTGLFAWETGTAGTGPTYLYPTDAATAAASAAAAAASAAEAEAVVPTLAAALDTAEPVWSKAALTLTDSCAGLSWDSVSLQIGTAIKFFEIEGSGVTASDYYFISQFCNNDATNGDQIQIRRTSDSTVAASSVLGTGLVTRNATGPTTVYLTGTGIRCVLSIDYRDLTSTGILVNSGTITKPLEFNRAGAVIARQNQLIRQRNIALDGALANGAAANAWQASGTVTSAAANAVLAALGIVQSIQIGTGGTLTFLYKTDFPPAPVLGKYAYVSQYVYSADGTHWPSGTFQFLAYTTTTSGVQNNPTVLAQGFDAVPGVSTLRRYWIMARMPTTGTVGRTETGFTSLVSGSVAEAGGWTIAYSNSELSFTNVGIDDWTGYNTRDDVQAQVQANIAQLQDEAQVAVVNYPWYNLVANGNLDPALNAEAFTAVPTYFSPPTSAGMIANNILRSVDISSAGILTDDPNILDASAANAFYFVTCYVYSSNGTTWPAVKFAYYAGATDVGLITFPPTNWIEIDANTRKYYLTGQFPNRTDLTRVRIGVTGGLGIPGEMSGYQFMFSPTTVLGTTNTPINDWYAIPNRPRNIAIASLSGDAVPNLVGKTIAWMGDSIVQSFNLPTLFATSTGATVLNFGFGGCCMSQVAGATSGTQQYYKNQLSGSALAASIASGNWSIPTSAAAALFALDPTQDHRATVATMAALDWSTVNYIWMSYGTNDWGLGQTLGVTTSGSVNDINGGYNTAINDIQGAFPAIPIILGTPMYRDDPSGLGDSNLNPNSSGVYMAQVQAAIAARALWYQLLCWQPQLAVGFNEWNYQPGSMNTVDGLHPAPPAQAIIIQRQTSWSRATI